MAYGWNIAKDESMTFGSLSREFYYASLLIDEIVAQNVREVRRLLKVQRARADVVVPERGVAALHVLAGLEAEDLAAAVTLRVVRRSRADPDVRSEEGLTPAHVAATYGRCRVLEVLLTNGANPSLIDYRLLLDAKEHAYKERQWQAYSMLTTYEAILENEERFSKYLDPNDDFVSAQRNRAAPAVNTSTYETDYAANSSKQLDYDEETSNKKGVSDWLEKSLDAITLDDNAVNIVNSHCKNIETYRCPDGQEEECIQHLDDKVCDKIGWKLGGNKVLTTKHYLEDKLPWLRSQTAEKKVSTHSCMEPKVERSTSSVKINLTTNLNLNKEKDVELFKGTPNSNTEETDLYVYGYAESALKSKSPHHENSVSSVCQKSYLGLDHSKGLNNNMLCKMSRIFLFILKKRHSTYNQLQ